MCEDFYGVDFHETLAELFRLWKVTMLDFMCSEEDIQQYDWLEEFSNDIRRRLPELKDYSHFADLFKIKSPFKNSSKIFEISFEQGKVVEGG